jgi:transcription-repair coupling factor (superfamily II helicase)
MPENGKVPLIISLFTALETTMLVVCSSEFAAQKLYTAVQGTLPTRTYFLPARTVHLSKARQIDHKTQGLRATALHALTGLEPAFVVGSVDAVRARLSPPDTFASLGFTLKAGQRLAQEQLQRALIKAGYERVESVDDYGQFAIRGGIVDIFLPDASAYRIDFFGEEIDTIRQLDPLSQRSTVKHSRADIPPCFESPLSDGDAKDLLERIRLAQRDAGSDAQIRLFQHYNQIEQGDYRAAYEVFSLGSSKFCAADYLHKGGVLVFDEPLRLADAANGTDADIAIASRELALKGNAPVGWDKHLLPLEDVKAPEGAILLTASALGRPGQEGLVFDLRPAQQFFGRMDLLCEDLVFRRKNGWRTLVVLRNEKRTQSFLQSLSERGVIATLMQTANRFAERGEVLVVAGQLGAGYAMEHQKTLVLSESEIYRNVAAPLRQQTAVSVEAIEIKEGEYAVHDVHGIGIYRGLNTITVEGRPKDFLLIEYRGGDKLYIPIDQIGRVHKYIGSGDEEPKLTRMGGQEWENAKKRVSQSVKKLAQDLVSLYATRQALRGHAFSQDTVWQQEFEESFEFEQTQGQKESALEIKRDMESPRIMDRLLCGDVGYGKTEVAMRAIFKCVMDAKQAMVLVPTTVLAQQHYVTMSARFEGYPIRVAMLSRFTSRPDQARVIEAFADGRVDVLIGTHRLLSKDVKPHDLGLLVVDEEQRFGVGHKETISDIKRTVDVLTMTATPIPRTLEMALVGIRDMSVIHTPPEERKPVMTFVGEMNDELMKEALSREIARDGQAYVLYNQVNRMEGLSAQIRALLPRARIVMAHGQMPEMHLERAMLAFYSGEADILVCSTIIENGLDIARANTIYVLDADRLGLAQLYQLRGRVGRSARTAYCYLTYPAQKQITETAEKRLEAVREFTELGSGFRLAMRDLEIRGAGNLLGPEQHGHMHNVGYDTYCRLLAQAVANAKGETVKQKLETAVDVPLSAHIPDHYIAQRRQKVEAYRSIAAIETGADAARVEAELTDRFGTLPQEVVDLIAVAALRSVANAQDAKSVIVRSDGARIRFHRRADVDLDHLLPRLAQLGKGAQFTRSDSPMLLIKAHKDENLRSLIRRTTQLLTANGPGDC